MNVPALIFWLVVVCSFWARDSPAAASTIFSKRGDTRMLMTAVGEINRQQNPTAVR